MFGYATGEYVVVDLRLQFGWRNSPGFWGLMPSALENSHTHSTFQDAAVFPQGAAAVERVRLTPLRGVSVPYLPRDCRTISGSSGYTCFFFRVELRRRRHSCRESMVAGRSSLYAGCAVVGVGPLSYVGRTLRDRLSSVVRQQNH